MRLFGFSEQEEDREHAHEFDNPAVHEGGKRSKGRAENASAGHQLRPDGGAARDVPSSHAHGSEHQIAHGDEIGQSGLRQGSEETGEVAAVHLPSFLLR